MKYKDTFKTDFTKDELYDLFNENELKNIGLICLLYELGFDTVKIKEILTLFISLKNNKEEQIKLLKKFRSVLLNEIHVKQQYLDKLDYMIYEIKTDKNN